MVRGRLKLCISLFIYDVILVDFGTLWSICLCTAGKLWPPDGMTDDEMKAWPDGMHRGQTVASGSCSSSTAAGRGVRCFLSDGRVRVFPFVSGTAATVTVDPT